MDQMNSPSTYTNILLPNFFKKIKVLFLQESEYSAQSHWRNYFWHITIISQLLMLLSQNSHAARRTHMSWGNPLIPKMPKKNGSCF